MIASQVDSDSGTIYQTIKNYGLAHAIDNSGGTLVRRRWGGNKDEKWRFVSPIAGSETFPLMDYTAMDKGIIVDSSSGGTSATFGACTATRLVWKVSKVDLGVADGSLRQPLGFISRLTLCRNIPYPRSQVPTISISQKKQQEPLLLTPSPSSWTVTTVPGSELKRIVSSDDPNCHVYAPDANGIWANLSSHGEAISTIKYDPESVPTDAASQFELQIDINSGEPAIISKSLQKALSVSSFTDDENTLVVSLRSGNTHPKGWEIIPVVPANRNWTLPTWLSKNNNGIPNLADGVYRISNSQTKACLALGSHAEMPGTNGVEITGNLKEVSQNIQSGNEYTDANLKVGWYIERDRNPAINPQLQT